MSAGVQTKQTTFADLIGTLEWSDREIRVDAIRTEPLGPEPDRAFVETVRTAGVMSPIWVEEYSDRSGDGYTVIDGFRRLRAAMECGHETIPARVLPGGSYTIGLLTLIANAQRSSNPVAEYYALIGLIDGKDLSETQIAQMSGMSVPTIRKRLALGNLIPDFMTIFELGELSTPAAEKLAKLSAEDQAACYAKWNENAGRLTGEDIRRVREASRAQVELPELPGMPEAPPPRDYTASALLHEVSRLRQDIAIGALDLVEVDQRLAAIETLAAGLRELMGVIE